MSDAVSSLFSYFAEQPISNVNVVDITVVSGYRPTQSVSYATGQLQYHPGHKGLPPNIETTPPSLVSSNVNNITQQFSDRTTDVAGEPGVLQNFAVDKEDPLTMTVTQAPETLVIASSKYEFTVTVTLSADPATGVMTGNTEGWYYCVMFGAPSSVPPIQ